MKMFSIIIDFLNGMLYRDERELEYCIQLILMEEGRLLNANN